MSCTTRADVIGNAHARAGIAGGHLNAADSETSAHRGTGEVCTSSSHASSVGQRSVGAALSHGLERGGKSLHGTAPTTYACQMPTPAIGMSTGSCRAFHGQMARAVSEVRPLGDAIELSALVADELPDLVSYLSGPQASDLDGLRHVSVHAPAIGVGGDWSSHLDLLVALPTRVSSIVVHPDVADPGPLSVLGERLVIENMDQRKRRGQTPREIADLLAELPMAGACIDLAHTDSIDPSGELADELLEVAGARLRQLHISELDGAGHHVPLSLAGFRRISPALRRCGAVPWILESACSPLVLTRLRQTAAGLS